VYAHFARKVKDLTNDFQSVIDAVFGMSDMSNIGFAVHLSLKVNVNVVFLPRDAL